MLSMVGLFFSIWMEQNCAEVLLTKKKKKVPLNDSKVEHNFLESESHFIDSFAISGDSSNFIHCTK